MTHQIKENFIYISFLLPPSAALSACRNGGTIQVKVCAENPEMPQTGLAAFTVDRRLNGLPAWLLERHPKITVMSDRLRLKWYCICRDKLCFVDYYHGKREPVDEQVAAEWARNADPAGSGLHTAHVIVNPA